MAREKDVWICVLCQAKSLSIGEGKRHVYTHLAKDTWPWTCPLSECEFYCKYECEYEKHRQRYSHVKLATGYPANTDRYPKANPKRLTVDVKHWLKAAKEEGDEIQRSRSSSRETGRKRKSAEKDLQPKKKQKVEEETRKRKRPVFLSPPQGSVKKQRVDKKSIVSTTDSSPLSLYVQEVIGPISSDSDDSLQDEDISRAEDQMKEAIKVERTKQSLERYPALEDILPPEERNLDLDEKAENSDNKKGKIKRDKREKKDQAQGKKQTAKGKSVSGGSGETTDGKQLVKATKGKSVPGKSEAALDDKQLSKTTIPSSTTGQSEKTSGSAEQKDGKTKEVEDSEKKTVAVEEYTPAMPTEIDAENAASVIRNWDSYHPTPLQDCIPIHRRHELEKPEYSPSLFAPPKKKVAESALKVQEISNQKQEVIQKPVEATRSVSSPAQQESSNGKATQTDPQWKLRVVDPRHLTPYASWVSPSLRTRILCWSDDFFYLNCTSSWP